MVASDFSRGNQFLRNRQFEEAVAAYRSAIAHNPDFYLAHHNLGEALEQLGRWEEAIGAYQRAVELKPEAAWSHLNLSRVLRQVGRVEEADKAEEQAVGIEPKLAGARSVANADSSWVKVKNVSVADTSSHSQSVARSSQNFYLKGEAKLDEVIAPYSTDEKAQKCNFYLEDNHDFDEALNQLALFQEAVKEFFSRSNSFQNADFNLKEYGSILKKHDPGLFYKTLHELDLNKKIDISGIIHNSYLDLWRELFVSLESL